MIRNSESSLTPPILVTKNQELACATSSSGTMSFNNVDQATRFLMLFNNTEIDDSHIMKLKFHSTEAKIP